MIQGPLKNSVEEVLSSKLGPPLVVLSESPVSGGCINDCYRINTDRGKFFIKINSRSAFPGMFEAEALGLETLRKADGLLIPEVVASGESENLAFLILEYIDQSPRSQDFDTDLGFGLAKIHRQSSNSFGFTSNNYIGSLAQVNEPKPTWPEFYFSQRLEPMAKKAFDKSELNREDLSQLDRLGKELGAIFPDEKPALLHGDLWSGNVISCEMGTPALVDPAVYYGNREMDLAMTLLFGGFRPDFYRAYEEAFPLETGWQERVPVCQLYPLLVHLILFGSSYYADVKSVIRDF
jgi:fructosamine-3-kinase